MLSPGGQDEPHRVAGGVAALVLLRHRASDRVLRSAAVAVVADDEEHEFVVVFSPSLYDALSNLPALEQNLVRIDRIGLEIADNDPILPRVDGPARDLDSRIAVRRRRPANRVYAIGGAPRQQYRIRGEISNVGVIPLPVCGQSDPEQGKNCRVLFTKSGLCRPPCFLEHTPSRP